MKHTYLVLCTLAAASIVHAEPTSAPVLVENGRAVAEIVSNERRPYLFSEAKQYAGEELQHWIGEITDAYVPIRRVDEPERAGIKTRILLERIDARSPFADDAKAIGATDGFAVRTTTASNGVAEIHIVACQDRGLVNGVYSFLERNSDIIWPRPEPALQAVFSKTKTLTATACDYRDVPVRRFLTYAWSWHTPNIAELDWYSRNYGNVFAPNSGARYGSSYVSAGKGHGFPSYTAPAENFEKHPEWYSLVNGKRSAFQVCFLNYDSIPTIVTNVLDEIRRRFPDKSGAQVRIDYFNLSNPDSWHLCQCEKCVAPFTCENGVVVQPTDPAFRSAQNFTFKNKIAREVRKVYPNVTIGEYAYYYTTQPPPFKLEDNIRIEYCPYGENMKAPISDDTSNANWHELLDGWGKSCRKTVYRTYTGCGDQFPRPLEYILQTNFIYCLSRPLPMCEFFNEGPLDIVSPTHPGFKQTWDTCFMLKWLIARLAWNPYADIEELRRDFCRRVYREAAEPMLAFHDLLRDSFFSDNLPCVYNGVDPHAYTLQYVVRPKLSDKLLGLLDTALAKARHPVSHELVARQKAWFEKWIAAAGDDRFVQMHVPYSAEKGLEKAFDSDVWEKAGKTGDFVITGPGEFAEYGGLKVGDKPIFRSTAAILHDRLNLYIRFDCYAPDMATLQGNVRPADGKEKGPRGDIMEFYLADGTTGVYYMMMMDVGNEDDHSKDCVYDAKMWDYGWNGGWERNVKRYDDRWTTIVKIPFDSIGLTAAQSGKLLFQAIRGKYYDSDVIDKKTGKPQRWREMASWNGGWVHQVQNFGQLILDVE